MSQSSEKHSFLEGTGKKINFSIFDYSTDHKHSLCAEAKSILGEEYITEEERGESKISLQHPLLQKYARKGSSCPIMLQPRYSCPGRNPWPCFQYPVYHATLAGPQSLPRHQTQHSNYSPSLKSHLATLPFSNPFISSSSKPHVVLLGCLIMVPIDVWF